jgi:hypothetical protein
MGFALRMTIFLLWAGCLSILIGAVFQSPEGAVVIFVLMAVLFGRGIIHGLATEEKDRRLPPPDDDPDDE